MDCGPACLAMVTEHYGLHPDRDLLRQLCDLSKGKELLLSKSSLS